MEFEPWPKVARLYRGEIVVTEKIDGTNAAVRIEQVDDPNQVADHQLVFISSSPVTGEGAWYAVGAQSRTRMITPADDNYGFARWVWDNAIDLVLDLGVGDHFGEWYGSGISRKYGLDHKRFALFNSARWGDTDFRTPHVHAVPVLYRGPFSDVAVQEAMWLLEQHGSVAVPGFDRPEGVVIWHERARMMFKVSFNGDGGKGA